MSKQDRLSDYKGKYERAIAERNVLQTKLEHLYRSCRRLEEDNHALKYSNSQIAFEDLKHEKEYAEKRMDKFAKAVCIYAGIAVFEAILLIILALVH